MINKCKICGIETKGIWRCEEHHRCDDCGTKENLIYAENGLLCDACLDKRIKKDIETFKGNTDFTSEITCPYCGYVYGDSYEIEDGEEDCNRCGNRFYVTKEVSVDYSTEKVK